MATATFEAILALASRRDVQHAYFKDELETLETHESVRAELLDIESRAMSESLVSAEIERWFDTHEGETADALVRGMTSAVILLRMRFQRIPWRESRTKKNWRPPGRVSRSKPFWAHLPAELEPLTESISFLETVAYECSDEFRAAARQIIAPPDITRCEQWAVVVKAFGYDKLQAWKRRTSGRPESLILFKLISVLDALGLDYASL